MFQLFSCALLASRFFFPRELRMGLGFNFFSSHYDTHSAGAVLLFWFARRDLMLMYVISFPLPLDYIYTCELLVVSFFFIICEHHHYTVGLPVSLARALL